MSDKIKMHKLTGDKDKDKLKGCYFLPTTEGYYNFYDKCEGGLALNVSSGNDFSFVIGPYTWEITDFLISGTATNGHASGKWSNNDNSTSIKDDPDGESGGFQAQSGGGTIDAEEAASSASA